MTHDNTLANQQEACAAILAPMGGADVMQAYFQQLGLLLTPLAIDADAPESAPLLLAYTPPQIAIAQALDAGVQPEQAVSDWCRQARNLIDYYITNPANASAFCAPAALLQSGLLSQWLSERHGIEFPEAAIEANIEAPLAWERGSPLSSLTASLFVATHPDVLEVMPELQAISLPLAWAEEPASELHQRAHSQIAGTSLQLTQAKEGGELILGQLHSVQEQLEAYHQDNNVITQELSVANADKAALQEALNSAQSASAESAQTIKALEAELADAKGEAKLVLDQLFLVQEQLEEYYLKNKELEQTQTDSLKKAEDLKQKVQQLDGELSAERQAKDVVANDVKTLLDLGKTLQPAPKRSMLSPARAMVKNLSPKHRQLKKDVELVRQSELFDREWYLEHNPDVLFTGADPAAHYVLHGGPEGRSPGPAFDAERYLTTYQDVADSGMNPLLHYLKFGKAEGRECQVRLEG
ncbi:hypothetical protein [uncultured Gilvimarinus sp.]|uniref:hypothetical protein n=1 Tax=uncultured Gilvimarinus sp. TaxID=1689143 RepID=UPI0030EDC8E9|tara:strand:- start:5380 stop:6786 length:1407 start_codon:yes stop_codon:yes gene_type:complete